MLALYRQFSQGIAVSVCASMSFVTLGYMMNDSHRIEKKQLANEYENRIQALNDKITKLRLENDKLKLKY